MNRHEHPQRAGAPRAGAEEVKDNPFTVGLVPPGRDLTTGASLKGGSDYNYDDSPLPGAQPKRRPQALATQKYLSFRSGKLASFRLHPTEPPLSQSAAPARARISLTAPLLRKGSHQSLSTGSTASIAGHGQHSITTLHQHLDTAYHYLARAPQVDVAIPPAQARDHQQLGP